METPDLSWFIGAGLGLFVHWDHASQQELEVSWPLVGRSLVRDADIKDDVSVAQYHSSAATFNPKKWDANALAKLARSCGARYAVFTTRHHSGYAMFHTATYGFSIEHSPFGSDITRQFVEAMSGEGLRVGLYYSLSDWHHPDYPAFTEDSKPYAYESYPRPDKETWARYLAYVRAQLTELLTQYGTIDLVWFDGQWERTAEEWHAAELRQLVTSLQPRAIVNDRLPGHGDYATPEQYLPIKPPGRPWELCMTMNDSWGWRASDTNYKSAQLTARILSEVVSRGGNLLLNVSPTGDGEIPDIQVSCLRELGAWIATHGDALLGVRPPPPSVDFAGPATMRGSHLYLHLIARPVESAIVRGIPIRRVDAGEPRPRRAAPLRGSARRPRRASPRSRPPGRADHRGPQTFRHADRRDRRRVRRSTHMSERVPLVVRAETSSHRESRGSLAAARALGLRSRTENPVFRLVPFDRDRDDPPTGVDSPGTRGVTHASRCRSDVGYLTGGAVTEFTGVRVVYGWVHQMQFELMSARGDANSS